MYHIYNDQKPKLHVRLKRSSFGADESADKDDSTIRRWESVLLNTIQLKGIDGIERVVKSI